MTAILGSSLPQNFGILKAIWLSCTQIHVINCGIFDLFPRNITLFPALSIFFFKSFWHVFNFKLNFSDSRLFHSIRSQSEFHSIMKPVTRLEICLLLIPPPFSQLTRMPLKNLCRPSSERNKETTIDKMQQITHQH